MSALFFCLIRFNAEKVIVLSIVTRTTCAALRSASPIWGERRLQEHQIQYAIRFPLPLEFDHTHGLGTFSISLKKKGFAWSVQFHIAISTFCIWLHFSIWSGLISFEKCGKMWRSHGRSRTLGTFYRNYPKWLFKLKEKGRGGKAAKQQKNTENRVCE